MQLRAHRVQAKVEARDHAEVAAAAAHRPEEVRVLVGAGAHASRPSAVTTSAALRLSTVMPYLRLSQPKPPPSVSPATPVVELMPTGVASPCAWASASRSAQRRAASTVTRARRRRIDTHRLHARQIDHDAVVADRAAGDVVSAAAHRQRQAALPREGDPRITSAAPRSARSAPDAGRSSRSRRFWLVQSRDPAGATALRAGVAAIPAARWQPSPT